MFDRYQREIHYLRLSVTDLYFIFYECAEEVLRILSFRCETEPEQRLLSRRRIK